MLYAMIGVFFLIVCLCLCACCPFGEWYDNTYRAWKVWWYTVTLGDSIESIKQQHTEYKDLANATGTRVCVCVLLREHVSHSLSHTHAHTHTQLRTWKR